MSARPFSTLAENLKFRNGLPGPDSYLSFGLGYRHHPFPHTVPVYMEETREGKRS